MSRRRRRQSDYFDMYCCMPGEFLLAYPQPRIRPLSYRRENGKASRNTNAFESTSTLKSSLHSLDARRSSERVITKNIMCIGSPDCEVEFYMKEERPRMIAQSHQHSSQMADGDRQNRIPAPRTFDEFDEHRSTRDREQRGIVRPTARRPPVFDSKTERHSAAPSRISRSTFPLNRISTWRKLQANITASHYERIQAFQREHGRLSTPHPTMLAPTSKHAEVDCSATSTFTSNASMSLLVDSQLSSSDSTSAQTALRLIDVNQRMLAEGDGSARECKTYSIENLVLEQQRKVLNRPRTNSSLTASTAHSTTDRLVPDSSSVLSLHRSDDIEEFQPVYDPLPPPAVVLNDLLLSSFFPTTSTSSPNADLRIFQPQQQIAAEMNNASWMILDSTADITDFVIVDQPRVTESRFVSESHPPKKVHSLLESIEELCLLIRTLLQHQAIDEGATSVQTAIATQLAILLTYLANPNRESVAAEAVKKQTIDKMTCTREGGLPPALTVETQTALESIPALETSKATHQTSSHTELRSTSVTLHLPGRRLHRCLSDTFLSRFQRSITSNNRLLALSESSLYPCRASLVPKEDHQRFLEHIGRKFRRYVELASSNTCFEASTEFTPDFLLSTANNSKYDNDDHTEQFGIDMENQDMPETLTWHSSKEQNHEQYLLFASVLDQQFTHQSNTEKDDASKSSITEINSLSIDSTPPAQFGSEHNDRLEKASLACQVLEPCRNASQRRMPTMPSISNEISPLYEKRTAKLAFKPSKIRSSLRQSMSVVGKRVLIKSNPSSRASSPTQRPYSSGHRHKTFCTDQEQLKRSSALNHNNNCHEPTHSIQSTTSIDAFDISATAQNRMLSNDSQFSISHFSLVNDKHDDSVERFSSDLSLVTDKLDSNIALAESLLDMLNSLDRDNSRSSTTNTSLLHMYIRQFLIQFDVRVHRERHRRRTSKRRQKKAVH